MARTNTQQLKQQILKEFDAIKENVSSMAWHGFTSADMFLLNARELREHTDKITELYTEYAGIIRAEELK